MESVRKRMREFPAAVGLRCHASSAHAQEAEHPVDHVEYRCAHGYGTDIPGIAYVAYDGHIDKSQQRHRDVGNNRRQRQAEYLLVAMMHSLLQR